MDTNVEKIIKREIVVVKTPRGEDIEIMVMTFEGSNGKFVIHAIGNSPFLSQKITVEPIQWVAIQKHYAVCKHDELVELLLNGEFKLIEVPHPITYRLLISGDYKFKKSIKKKKSERKIKQ